MRQLERLQVLTEIVGEFRTAIHMDQAPEKTGRLVLEVIQASGDDVLEDCVLNAYLKLSDREQAVRYLNDAIAHLHEQIDRLMAESQGRR